MSRQTGRAVLELEISQVDLHDAAADLSVGAEELAALVQERLARLAAASGSPAAAPAAAPVVGPASGLVEVAGPGALADAVAREVWQSVRGHLEAGGVS